ncbi:hypothetical protein BaRGS_00020741 [Batillaria attramentaria]|uniref:Uncharacterized protein n=1 Tax=Batillaria attramentaria TaxID=370345 RepID=A0ABD0KLQ1_9CAEN
MHDLRKNRVEPANLASRNNQQCYIVRQQISAIPGFTAGTNTRHINYEMCKPAVGTEEHWKKESVYTTSTSPDHSPRSRVDHGRYVNSVCVGPGLAGPGEGHSFSLPCRRHNAACVLLPLVHLSIASITCS